MESSLKLDLETEKSIYQRLIKSNRKDMLAKIVIDKVIKQINTIESRLENEEIHRKEMPKHYDTSRVTQPIDEDKYRSRNQCHSYYYPVFKVS